MEVKACRRCRKLFNYAFGDVICPVCREEEEKAFQDVKDYLRDGEHKTATEQELNDKFGVSYKTIRQWIKEGRLELTPGSVLCPRCSICGKEILSGDLCEDCQKQQAKNINTLGALLNQNKPVVEQPKRQERDGNKMRFLGSERR